MTPFEVALLIVAGLVAGIANTVAAGGSLLAVPLLIFMGVPATVANATARPAIVAQNIFAVAALRRRGFAIREGGIGDGLLFGLCAVPGAVVGAIVATRITDGTFENILAVVMILVLAITLIRRRAGPTPDREIPRRARSFMAIGFIFIGFYGGFIQAGVGFVIMALLMNTTRLSLAEINARKVTAVLVYTTTALVVFIWKDWIAWGPAVALVAGQWLGGYLGGVLSVRLGDRRLVGIYAVLLAIFATSLLLR